VEMGIKMGREEKRDEGKNGEVNVGLSVKRWGDGEICHSFQENHYIERKKERKNK